MNDGSSAEQLAGLLRESLGRYSVGEKLPSSRTLRERYGVGPVTVSRAIALLTAEGAVVSRPGAGVFRAPPPRRPAAGDLSWQEVALGAHPRSAPATGADGITATLAPSPPGVIDLNGGYPAVALQPERALAAALARAGRRPGTWGRPPLEGLPELRSWFARRIAGPEGPLTAADVLITTGGQAALTTALRSLAAPGAPVLVESPTYPGILAVARTAGLRPVPVPVDRDGLRTDLLAEAFRVTGARLLVCQPLFHNPTGAVLSPERRAETLRIARAAGAFVVEDDFARRLAHADAPPLPAPLAAQDPDGVVVHIASLTKAASPSLRVAALAARGPAMERLRATHVVDSLFVPRPIQETALELVASPAWRAHLRRLSETLRQRREILAAALRRELPGLVPPVPPYGGFHLWQRLPDHTDDTALAAAALRAGVAVTPGRPYFPAEPPGPYLRLSMIAAAAPEHLGEGARLLRRATDTLTGQGPSML
ncbi:PLP-dependent aminotransferase family protein [Streptomyces aidingensis]|uniref:DNA-binding transcriptional regulator, MocR family, contains an aminotransferase domain n=1 Tax=Streptomyces aidingensis TaxID=910347 RepID=A0A1I1HXZ3_9ACTN|nr:PLP-dependent aminotransferase family protein [Streptomyces aidingensis]SFC26848.1 DNA-binding transcriptional regulator, MocR family, contains an aminotransferase domain [Streptomyces aidingensis]